MSLKLHSFKHDSESKSRIVKFWVFVALSLFFLVSCDKGENGAPDRAKMEEANKAFDEENYDKAKSSVEYFLAQYPEDIDALYFYAQVLIATNQGLKAREKANEILKIDPDAAEARAILAEVHYGRKEFAEAIKLSREALIRNIQLQAPYRVIGEIYLREGKVKESIKVLLEAHNLKPNDVETLKKLSAAYIKDKNYVEAKKLLDQALTLDDRVPGVHYNLAMVYANMDNGPKALEHIERALEYYQVLETFHWVGKARDMRRVIIRKFKLKE